ncbi:MAG: hypothetical protein ACT4PW_12550 [Acidimicrobiia bacterium]
MLRSLWLALMLAVVVPLGAAVVALRDPATVGLQISNPTAYAITVEVDDGQAQGLLPVAVIDRRASRAFEHVIDQGDTWVFHFSGQGRDGGELRLGRAELEAAGWSIQVPDAVGTRLAELGAPPTP